MFLLREAAPGDPGGEGQGDLGPRAEGPAADGVDLDADAVVGTEEGGGRGGRGALAGEEGETPGHHPADHGRIGGPGRRPRAGGLDDDDAGRGHDFPMMSLFPGPVKRTAAPLRTPAACQAGHPPLYYSRSSCPGGRTCAFTFRRRRSPSPSRLRPSSSRRRSRPWRRSDRRAPPSPLSFPGWRDGPRPRRRAAISPRACSNTSTGPPRAT